MSLAVALLSALLLQRADDLTLSIRVADTSGRAAQRAIVFLSHTTDQRSWESSTGESGRVQFTRLPTGPYVLRIVKDGYYADNVELRLEASKVVDFTLVPMETRREEVEVIARPEPINPEAVSPQQNVNDEVIQNLPYTGRRDFLNALALMPGVVRDPQGGMHIHGSSADQIRYQLDGINITDPSGGIASNIPIDAIESVDLDLSGYSAEFGKGSGGIVRVESKFIGDTFRWNVTDFIPGVNFKRRALADFTPRLLLSGPLARHNSWFMYSGSLRYDRTFSDDSPDPVQNQTIADQLLKLQWNLGEGHVLTTSLLNNSEYYGNLGLGTFRPLETTTNLLRRGTTVAVSNRNIVEGTILETTVQWTHRRESNLAKGIAMLIVRPDGWAGNFHTDQRGRSDRFHLGQAVSMERKWASVTHRLKFGGEYDHVTSDLHLDRRPFQFLDDDERVKMAVRFEGNTWAQVKNQEIGFFLQDRVVISPKLQTEIGLRADTETIVGGLNLSPRWSMSFLPAGSNRSKVSGGVGLFVDNVPLDSFQLPDLQHRITTSYAVDGSIESAPAPADVRTSANLRNPYGIHWNVAWEQEWAPRWVSRINFIQKRGRMQTRLSAIPRPMDFDLVFENSGRSSYDAIEFSIDRPLRTNLRVLASYTYSQAKDKPSLSLDFPDPSLESIDAGLVSWNTTHRFLTWGYFPFLMKSSASYAIEARSGFPFSPIDQLGQLAGPYNGLRMPAFFSTNFSLEREVPFFFHKRVAIRIGATNLFNRFNPRSVEPHVDSPNFLRLSDSSGRALVGRVRLIKN